MSNFNVDDNFWNIHPELKIAGEFKSLYTSDKSRNKANSSKLAWAILLIWDRESRYYNLPEEGEDNKIDLIFDEHYGDVTYYKKNKEKVLSLRDYYLKITETIAQRTLRGIEEKLSERHRFLRKTPYDDGDPITDVGEWAKRIDTIDKMMERTEKIYNLYEKARKVVEQEQQTNVMGDAQESLSDGGEI